MNILTLIISIQQLLGDPNPNDPLDVDIAKEYVQQYQLYLQKAKESTKCHAITKNKEMNTLKESSSSLNESGSSLFTGTVHESSPYSPLNDQTRSSITSSPSLHKDLLKDNHLQQEQEHHLKECKVKEHKLNEKEKECHPKEYKLNEIEKDSHLKEQTQYELNRNNVPSKRDTSPCKTTSSLQKKSKLSMLSRKRK
jgi:hypothetical protein